MVAFTDGTAGVQNDSAFRDLVEGRRAAAIAMQRVNDILSGVLADSTEQHPAAAAIARIEGVIKSAQAAKVPWGGRNSYVLALKDALQNLSNFQKAAAAATSPVEREQSLVHALIDKNKEDIPNAQRHSELVKEVGQ